MTGSSGLIEEVLRTHGRIVAARQGVLGDERITGAQSIVLNAIAAAETPPTVPRIARSLGYTRQAIQRLVDKLNALGFVDTRTNPDHARARLLVLSDEGKRLYENARARREAWATSLVRDIPSEKLAEAVDTIRKLRLTIEEDLRSRTREPENHEP